MSQRAEDVLTPEHPFVGAVHDELRRVYGDRLCSVAIFGSVARRSARRDSDLDLFVVVDGLPCGRGTRLRTFDAVEEGVARRVAELARHGIAVELNAVLRTPDDLKTATPLMLDLTEDAVVLQDEGGILAAALEDLRCRLRRLGSRRIWRGDQWYWDLKPDYKRGEIFRL